MNLILRNSGGKLPQYVASKFNPADVSTRPFRIAHEERCNLWTRGPRFLWQQQPKLNCLHHFSADSTKAAKDNEKVTTLCNAGLFVISEKKSTDDAFLQYTLERTSDLTKAIRVVSNVAKCFELWRELSRGNCNSTLDLSQKETDLRAAKLKLIRAAQRESFGKILNCMREGHTFEDALVLAKMKNVASLCHIKKYVPFLDSEGILRVGRRMDYAEKIGEQERHPDFLPHMHDGQEFSSLISIENWDIELQKWLWYPCVRM